MPSARTAESTEIPRAKPRGIPLLTQAPSRVKQHPHCGIGSFSLCTTVPGQDQWHQKNVYKPFSVTATRKKKTKSQELQKKGQSKVEIYSTALRRESTSGQLPKTQHPPSAGSTPTALGRWDRKLVIKWALYFISFINIFFYKKN